MIKIISQNISGAGYRKGKEREKRLLKPFVIENVLSFNPDVIFFLEYAFPINHEEVVKQLRDAGYDVRTTDVPTQKNQNGILAAVKEGIDIIAEETKMYTKNTKNLEHPDALVLTLKKNNEKYKVAGIRVRVGSRLSDSERLKLKADQIQVIESFLAESSDKTIVVGDTNYEASFLEEGHLGASSEYKDKKRKITSFVKVSWEGCKFVVPEGDSYQFKINKDKEPIKIDCDLAITKNIDKFSVEPYNWDFENKDEMYIDKERYQYIDIKTGFYPDHPAVIFTVE
jgi:hypothetical protein